MAKFIIEGGKKLKGTVKISGNKNAVLPLMAASLLTSEDCILENVPKIGDVTVLAKILKDLGAEIEGLGTNRLVINTRKVNKYTPNSELVQKLRASILLLGPLLARFGKAQMRHPGGCMVGRRAVGTHFDALAALGAETITSEENYESKVKNPRSAYIFLDEASVTATENAMMMAALIPGTTVIDDAACEPHVEDLANFLNLMGAKITGAGTNRIMIQGAKKLKGAKFTVGPDYIDAGTFAIVGAVTKSEISIEGVREKDLLMILLYLRRMGVKCEVKGDVLTVLPSKLIAPKGKIQTRPWPGFPTDLMSPFIVLATQAKGTTLCHDWMYESRMFFVDRLIAMGANITLCDPHRVLVSGPTKLRGKVVETPDIRAGMALVIAALCAEGESEIKNIEIIERGYEKVEERLKSLGAKIKRME
ncbi:MAG: UDP-N-acetylglucosamine 1-carboxyvinyltransferase [Microgenomates group bacterium]